VILGELSDSEADGWKPTEPHWV